MEVLVKKPLVIFVLVVICVNIVACEPAWFQFFDYEVLKEEVTKVDLIYYHNPNPVKYVFNKPDRVQDFDFSKVEVVEVLSDEKIDEFLFALAAKEIAKGGKYLNSPRGYCLRVVYRDGNFEILSCQLNFSCGYFPNGKVRLVMGSGVGYLFSNQFFETQIGRYEEE